MTHLHQFILPVLALYLLLINLLAVILTLLDKSRARKEMWRVPEKTLLLVGFLGGALGEWIAMLLIRHKTKHAKFMLLLPLFFTVHILLLGTLVIFLFS